jgi:hypothetical protein
MGMGSVRFRGCNDDCGDGQDADVVIGRLGDLPARARPRLTATLISTMTKPSLSALRWS